jgi:hypothetical protein
LELVVRVRLAQGREEVVADEGDGRHDEAVVVKV